MSDASEQPAQNVSKRAAAMPKLIAGIAIWLGVALSLGWYYTFTYYGRTGVPMPTFEPCAALVLYYFSVLNVRTEIQAVHWMLVYPAAALLWAQALRVTARYFKLPCPSFTTVFFLMSCAALPLVLPAPWMTWIAGYAVQPSQFEMMERRFPDGFSFQRMLHVALRRDEQSPWTWLTPLYLALGVSTLGLQLRMYNRLFKQPLAIAAKHYLLSAVVLSASAAVVGAAAGIPLRLLLER